MWSLFQCMSRRTPFISHACCEHESLIDEVRNGLAKSFPKVKVDPFRPGDWTALKAEQSIKESTHFVLLNTVNSQASTWVELESLFAKLCFDKQAICYLPINVDRTPVREEAASLIAINWSASDGIQTLVQRIEGNIRSTYPKERLALDERESHKLKDQGRDYEREHFKTGNWEYNWKAISTYEQAILLNFCNYYAWANLAWTLWKQREDPRAQKCLHIAELLEPHSKQVKAVGERIRTGNRQMQ